MVAQQTGRYSKYIRPISILFDLITITFSSLYFLRYLNLDEVSYLLFQTTSWIIIAALFKYYEVFRFTTPVEIISKLVKQFSVFILVTIAYFPFVKTAISSSIALRRSPNPGAFTAIIFNPPRSLLITISRMSIFTKELYKYSDFNSFPMGRRRSM